jgi:hypothetical protein
VPAANPVNSKHKLERAPTQECCINLEISLIVYLSISKGYQIDEIKIHYFSLTEPVMWINKNKNVKLVILLVN